MIFRNLSNSPIVITVSRNIYKGQSSTQEQDQFVNPFIPGGVFEIKPEDMMYAKAQLENLLDTKKIIIIDEDIFDPILYRSTALFPIFSSNTDYLDSETPFDNPGYPVGIKIPNGTLNKPYTFIPRWFLDEFDSAARFVVGKYLNNTPSYKFVQFDTSGNVIEADPSTLINTSVIGMSIANVTAGSLGLIMVDQEEITNPLWSFTNIGQFAYLGSNGDPTDIIPSGLKEVIGLVVNSDTLLINSSSSQSASPEESLIPFTFDYTATFPLNLVTVPAGRRVVRCVIHVDNIFNGANTLSIGVASNHTEIVQSSDVDLKMINYYEVFVDQFFATTDTIQLYTSFVGSTTGQISGYVIFN